MSQPIKHTGTPEIVCPWCGCKQRGLRPWETIFGYLEHDLNCVECKSRFHIDSEQEHTITYTTTKININREGKNVKHITNLWSGSDGADLARR